MIPEIYGHGFVAQFREPELGGATQIPEVRFYTQAPQTSGNIFEVIKKCWALPVLFVKDRTMP
ncbi:MAG: hypothetical protein ABIG69_18230 [Bacteroidota bacterium]